MKTPSLVAILLMMSSVTLLGQSAFPEDATWHYRYDSGIGSGLPFPSSGYHTLSVIGMTTIDGHECQVIHREQLAWYISNFDLVNPEYSPATSPVLEDQYVYADGDVVYFYVNGEFKILYDWSAELGDTWQSEAINAEVDPFQIEVIEIGLMDIGGGDIRRYLDLTGPDYALGRAVEGIGLISGPIAAIYLFPVAGDHYPAPWDGELFQFNCFTANAELVYQEFDYCESTPLGVEEYEPINLKMYPNPTQDQISIESGQMKIDQLRIIDASGRSVLECSVLNETEVLDLSTLDTGIYSLTILSDGQWKVVKDPIIKY